jgi:signal peptidase I
MNRRRFLGAALASIAAAPAARASFSLLPPTYTNTEATSRLTREAAEVAASEFCDVLRRVGYKCGYGAAVGRSMQPTHSNQCVLLFETDVKVEQVRIGDIVRYVADPSKPLLLTVHRVFDRGADGSLWTRGDNNRHPDPVRVTNDNLRGRVFACINLRREGSA